MKFGTHAEDLCYCAGIVASTLECRRVMYCARIMAPIEMYYSVVDRDSCVSGLGGSGSWRGPGGLGRGTEVTAAAPRRTRGGGRGRRGWGGGGKSILPRFVAISCRGFEF